MLSYFNYVCLEYKKCGEQHSHTVHEFNTFAVPDLQAKYLAFGHVGGWRGNGSCPTFIYEPENTGCFVTEEICENLKAALNGTFVVTSTGLEEFVKSTLSMLMHESSPYMLPKKNTFDKENNPLHITANATLNFPHSLCDNELYSRALAT